MSTRYLVHHGIDGQKWGVRNGPPYPIEPGHHSAAEKRENSDLETKPTKRSIKELSNDELREMTERTRLENEFIRQQYEAMRLKNGPQINNGQNWLQKTAQAAKNINTIIASANSVAKVFGFDTGKYIQGKVAEARAKAEAE